MLQDNGIAVADAVIAQGLLVVHERQAVERDDDFVGRHSALDLAERLEILQLQLLAHVQDENAVVAESRHCHLHTCLVRSRRILGTNERDKRPPRGRLGCSRGENIARDSIRNGRVVTDARDASREDKRDGRHAIRGSSGCKQGGAQLSKNTPPMTARLACHSKLETLETRGECSRIGAHARPHRGIIWNKRRYHTTPSESCF